VEGICSGEACICGRFELGIRRGKKLIDLHCCSTLERVSVRERLL
jgi:hypothetical protein